MFCERCGNQIDDALNFCSLCGERVRKDDIAEIAKVRTNAVDSISTVTIVIGAAGLLFLVGLVAVLVEKVPDAMIAIVAIYIAAWFAIMYRLVSQMIKVMNSGLENKRPTASQNEPLGIRPKATAQLADRHEVPASVTETTTRDLEKVPKVKL